MLSCVLPVFMVSVFSSRDFLRKSLLRILSRSSFVARSRAFSTRFFGYPRQMKWEDNIKQFSENSHSLEQIRHKRNKL